MTGCVEKLNLTEIETQVVIKKELFSIVFQVQFMLISWKASIPTLGRGFFEGVDLACKRRL